MSARTQEQELIIDDLTKQRNHYEEEVREKRREVIDLTAELDRAKQQINELERKAEAWQEAVDNLELELDTRQITDRYLKSVFMFAFGITVGLVIAAWLTRWYL